MYDIEEQRRLESWNQAFGKVDNFFEKLHDYSTGDISNLNLDIYSNLNYREEQHSYALDIMETIKNRDILLVEAGVGIGKSFGYLLPIFHMKDNYPVFNKVIISTSSIALQEQLLKDIKRISKMLNIEIKASIAKGVNNYACIKRICAHKISEKTPKHIKDKLDKLHKEILMKGSNDKSDLKTMSEEEWEHVKLQSRGFCSNCEYKTSCPFLRQQDLINHSNIIITNHANMIKNVMDSTELTEDLSMIIFDEAHKVEENILGVRENVLKLDYLRDLIDEVDIRLNYGVKALKVAIEQVFAYIRYSASGIYRKNTDQKDNGVNYSIVDTKRLSFNNTTSLNKWLLIAKEELEKVLIKMNKIYDVESKQLIQIKELKFIIEDMLKNTESKNLYWAEFYEKNRITIHFVPKNKNDISKKIFGKNIPVVCTSGTMLDTENSYNQFANGLDLNKLEKRSINYGEVYKSPYNYEENTLFYYSNNISNPNNREEYIKDLVVEINELIRITNGKALVLFTSKETMNKVYEYLTKTEEYPFDILLQTDTNTKEIKERFANDTNSCLFATGAFWEGIDISGKSLSNLIITHLPFDQVDAVTRYEASKYVKTEQFKQVYFPNMVTKLKQAIGRLIRSDEDSGIVCCLDSRFEDYKEAIIPNLVVTNYTTEKSELYEFVDSKIFSKENTKTLIK